MPPNSPRNSLSEKLLKTVHPRYRWWVVFMLWWVCFFNYADRQAIFSVFPSLKAEFHFTKLELGLIGSAFMWVYAAGAPFAGWLGDRLPRKQLILGGCLFWSGITMLTGRCTSLWQFVRVRALEGLGETFYFPASMSLLSDYHSAESRSRALSFHQSSVYAGTILGSWLGALFAQHVGWRAGFYFFGGAGIVLALLLWRFLREPARGESEREPQLVSAVVHMKVTQKAYTEKQPVAAENKLIGETAPVQPAPASWRALLSPVVLLLMLAFVFVNFVATVFLTWTPTYLVERYHFELASAGLSGAVFIHLASAIGAPAAGILADRLIRRYRGGRMLVQALGLFVGSGFVYLIGYTQSVPMLLAAMTCFGFCKGLYDANIFASLYDVVGPERRGVAAGMMNTVGWSGGALGPVVVGWLSLRGPLSTEMQNMGWAISRCSLLYLLGGTLVLSAALLHQAQYSRKKSTPPILP